MKNLILLVPFLGIVGFADHGSNHTPTAKTVIYKDEFMDACKIECPKEVPNPAKCTVKFGKETLEGTGDNRCFAFQAICNEIRTRKGDPKTAREHTCHPL